VLRGYAAQHIAARPHSRLRRSSGKEILSYAVAPRIIQAHRIERFLTTSLDHSFYIAFETMIDIELSGS
jgi:hypothetical protein